MEVMNRAELTQTDILVGQKSVTRSFGVSDDPMLMSMLSTGFYQRPLRTMIQEIMFNAWDAHRMGNCQHRPIDIYLNETTGLIIRDYGPGIDPGEDDDNMHEIYCMYGGSTKRKLKNQTGGFGLGSKSPFAYTESFTVTSHYGGTKNMYLISRVSESNGGKPGMTSLVRVPTTETGLLVTVPLKKGDLIKAYEFVKDVLFLSGIKAMIHFEEEADEFVDSANLGPGEYLIDEDHRQGRIYAVYGGVRYEIPHFEEYDEEFSFMKLISKGYDMFVGFAPDTLSPLPNREGLNMGEKSKESVKANFELCMEKFEVLVDPVIKSFFKTAFNSMKMREIQGQFALIDVCKYGLCVEADSMKKSFLDIMKRDIPSGTEEKLWGIMCNLIITHTSSVFKHVTIRSWIKTILLEFIKAYPDHKELAFAANKLSANDFLPLKSRDTTELFVAEFYRHRFLREQAKFVYAMKQEFPLDDTLHPDLRLVINDDWVPVVWDRGFGNAAKTKYGIKKLTSDYLDKRRSSKGLSLENLWSKKGEQDLNFNMMSKRVILAKTVTTLKDMPIPVDVQMHNFIMKGRFHYYDGVSVTVPAYVVYQRKGAYDKAKQIFESMGYTIYEAEEPEKKVYTPKAKTVQTYPMIQPNHGDTWQSNNENDQFPDPTHFFYATQATLKSYYAYDRPERELVYWFRKKNPKFVALNHMRSVEVVKKLGAIEFHEGVHNWYSQVSQDKDRMTNIIRAAKITSLANLPNSMLKHPLIQLELGMEPVDKSDEDFWYESEGYNLIMSSHYNPLSSLKKLVSNELDDLWKKDPEAKNIMKMCKVTDVFNSSTMSSLWSTNNPKAQDQLVDKVISTLKLFA